MAEIIAYDKAHPRPTRPVIAREEPEGPEPIGMDPGAKPVSSFGSLVKNNGVNPNNFVSPYGINTATQTIYSNFLAISSNESGYVPPDNCGEVGDRKSVV